MSKIQFGKPTEPCQPMIFLDGHPAPDVELDDLYMDEVLAVEVYRTQATTPPQFVTGGAAGCATVVIWTQ